MSTIGKLSALLVYPDEVTFVPNVRDTLELILTSHALDRLNDSGRFPATPDLPFEKEVRLLHLRRSDTREVVWMVQITGGL